MGTNVRQNIVTNGLVLYLDAGNRMSYPGSGTTWRDLSGQGYNGTLSGTTLPTFNSANQGNIVFNGANNFINTNITASLRSITGTRSTISTWFSVPNASVRSTLLGDWDTSGNNETARLEIGGWVMTTGKIGGTINSLGANTTAVQSTTTIQNNTWYNAVLLYDGTAMRIYVNGVLEASVNAGERGSNSIGTFTIGRPGAFNGGYFTGNIANVQIYNRALSPAEVAQNYNATKTRFGLT